MSKNIGGGSAQAVPTKPYDKADRVRHAIVGARAAAVRHGDRMEADASYKQSFDRVVDQVEAKGGRLGENARLFAALQEFLCKVL